MLAPAAHRVIARSSGLRQVNATPSATSRTSPVGRPRSRPGRTVPVGPERAEGRRVADYLRAACETATNATVGDWQQVTQTIAGLPVRPRD